MNKAPSMKSIFLWVLLIVAYLFPYSMSHLVSFSLASVLIVFLSLRILALEDVKKALQFFLQTRMLVCFVVVCSVFMLLSHYLVGEIVEQNSIQVSVWPLMSQFKIFFQALNEEIVFRAILLGSLIRWKPQHTKLWILSLGLIFSLSHLAHYIIKDQLFLSAESLLSLFFFGLATSLFYVKSESIFYPLLFHYAWNSAKFGRDYFIDGKVLSEGQGFLYFEGNKLVLSLSVLLFLSSLLYKKAKASSYQSSLVK